MPKGALMITLYIDTTLNYLYLALVKDNKLLNYVSAISSGDLSLFTVSELERILNEENLKVKDINKVIVVNGPGSFTGIRIGVTIAKTLAWSLNIDITTISSLEAMAISTSTNKYKVPMIDARRDHSYAGIYDNNNQVIMENQYISHLDLKNKLEDLNQEYVYISNTDDLNTYEPDFLKIVNYAETKQSINPHLVVPNYLKKTQAEEELNV